MREVPEAIVTSPALRAFRNALCLLRGIDMPDLVTAGVLSTHRDFAAMEADPVRFFLRLDDKRAAALWAAIQARMPADLRAAPSEGRLPLVRAGTKLVCPRGHAVATTQRDLYGANLVAGLKGSKIDETALAMGPDQPAWKNPDVKNGIPGSLARCHCGAPWFFMGSLLTAEDGWVPPLCDEVRAALDELVSA